MNRSELIDTVADKHNLPKKHAEAVVSTMFGSIFEMLVEEGRVEIRGFGSFTTRDYHSYVGRNPKTGEAVSVGSKRLPYFKVGKELKARLNYS